jgi:starch-binding outer membrane protein, SusD/RagB family
MKRFKILPATIIFIILSGCSEDFLENPPLTTITDVTFPQNERDALIVTNAAYNNLRNWWYMGGYPLASIMSDDQVKGSEDGSNPDLQQFETFTFSPTHAYILAWYQTLYQSVRRANIVIEKVPPISMNEDLKKRYIAEARFLRAYHYFTLTRLWGDIPKVTVVNPPRTISRSPSAEIYNEIIIPDLLEAAEVLPEKSQYPAEDLGRVTKGAAKTLLARVYLTLGDFQNAEKYALEVINSGQYSLDPDYPHIFSKAGENGVESIFEVGALPLGNGEGGNQYGNTQGVRGTPNWGWGFGRPSWDYITSFEPGDPRMDASVIFLGEILSGTLIVGSDLTTDTNRVNGNIVEVECYNQKVYVEGANSTQDNWGHNRRILRYADVLLMAAEALNENGNPAQALIYLNKVRERARGGLNILPDHVTTVKEQLRDLIWKERRSELAFEDVRYYDLKRQGRMSAVLGPLGFKAGKNELLPIPQQEIDLSEGKMEQNTNWN